MAKPKLKDLKTYFDSLDEAGVRDELLKLFGKLLQFPDPLSQFYP